MTSAKNTNLLDLIMKATANS